MHLNDCKYQALITQTGSSGHVNDLFLKYLQDNGATSDNIQDAQREFLIANGATEGHLNDMWYEFYGLYGATQEHINDREYYFWCTLGGALGPTAVIQNVDCQGCTFEEPDTSCTAQCQYTGNALNFTEPIVSYTWGITGNGTIIAGAGTDTVTVETGPASTSQAFTLTLTIAAATESDDTSRTITHTHKDVTEPPVFIGPDIGNPSFPQGNEVGPFDIDANFSGTTTGYELVGAWPNGIVISSDGVISGTYDDAEGAYDNLSVRAFNTNDEAFSNTFTLTITEAEAVPIDFHALTPDSTTHLMEGVHTGWGDLTATHAQPLYAPDHEGVYQQFPANAPVWAGGRCVLSAGAGSPVTAVYADNGSGTPLPEVPYLQYYPAAQNDVFPSNDLTVSANWSQPAGAIVTSFDQVGLTGAANTATLLDKQVSGDAYTQGGGATPADTRWYTTIFWVTKRAINTYYSAVSMQFQWAGANAIIQFYQDGSATHERIMNGNIEWEMIDEGDRLKFIISLQNDGFTRSNPCIIHPAHSTVAGSTQEPTLGSCIVENVNYHPGKTLAECRGLGPIYTTTAATNVAETEYGFDLANLNQTGSAIYLEMQAPVWPTNTNVGAGQVVLMPFCLRKNGGRGIYVEPTSPTQTLFTFVSAVAPVNNAVVLSDDDSIQVGVSHYATSDFNINVDGTWGTSATAEVYTALDPAISIDNNNLTTKKLAFKVRNMRSYDIADYAEGVTIIDGLMP